MQSRSQVQRGLVLKPALCLTKVLQHHKYGTRAALGPFSVLSIKLLNPCVTRQHLITKPLRVT